MSVAEESHQELSSYNANAHIISANEWSRQDPAYTRNGEVFMRADIPEEQRGMIAPHEATHVMKHLAEKLGKSEVLQQFNATTAGKVANWLGNKAGEGLEEVVTGIGDPLLERLTWNPKADLATVDELADDFIGGVALSMFMSGGEALATNMTDVIQQRQQPVVESISPETAKPLRVGRATTIYNPYQGPVPVQTQSSGQTVEVPEFATQRAQEYTKRAQSAMEAEGNHGFKTFLTRLYQSTFQRNIGVPVENMAYDRKPYLVNISNSVPAKVISDRNLSLEKLSLLDVLPDIVRNGEYVGSGGYDQHGAKVKPVIRYDYFETPVRVNNVDYIARFDVEVYPGANNYRTHQLVNMDLTQTEARYPAPVAGPSSAESSPQQNYIPQSTDHVNPPTIPPIAYAALLRALLESKAAPPGLTPEQRAALEAWNNAFPELRMTEEEFLGR